MNEESDAFVTTTPCCDECQHLSHSDCFACGMSDRDCMAKLWPQKTAPT